MRRTSEIVEDNVIIFGLLMSEDSLRGRDVREGSLMMMLQAFFDLSCV
jgi:hypothetical protein